MGKVIIMSDTTKKPITLMGESAGVCWGADITDEAKNYKRGLDCIESGHGRVMEYPNIRMVLDGYSAKVIREFYTHIGGSPSRLQSSTRYINYAAGDGFEYVTPKSVQDKPEALTAWNAYMEKTNDMINKLVYGYGIPIEDATMLLPLTYCTKIIVKCNPRYLIDMSHQRKCNRAYWEYRQLFKDIEIALSEYSDEWEHLVKTQMKPKCKVLGYCPEKKCCGLSPKKAQ